VEDSAACRIRVTDTGLEVPLHVQPRARHTGVCGLHNGALKLKVSAPPVDDAANRAIVDYFAKALDLPKSRLRIAAGHRSRDKVLAVDGVSRQRFFEVLAGLPS
jgi:uncharacterized protein (TIGR00251 family)